jgi:hypothetical protein
MKLFVIRNNLDEIQSVHLSMKSARMQMIEFRSYKVVNLHVTEHDGMPYILGIVTIASSIAIGIMLAWRG